MTHKWSPPSGVKCWRQDFLAVLLLAVVVFFAGDLLAVVFFAVDFLAGDLLAVDFFAAEVLLVVVFFAVDFFAGDFFAVDFLAGDLLAVDFFAAEVFLVVVFFAVDFLAVLFFAVDFFAGVAFAVALLVVFLAAAAVLRTVGWAVDVAASMVSFGSFLAPETTAFRSAPALNFGTEVFLAWIRSPVRGLRTMRACRTRFSKEPKPVMATFSPLATSRVMVSSTDSSAWAAFLRLPS